MVTSLLSSVLRACARSVRPCSALRTAPSTSSGSARNSGRSTGVMVARHSGSSVPLTIRRFSDELRGGHRRFGLRQGLPPRGRFGLRLHDVERRHGADLDARPVVLDQLVGEVQRADRHVHRLPGEHQFPVGVAHVGDRLRQRAAQLDLRDVVVDRGDPQLQPRAVDLKSRSSGCVIVAARFALNVGLKLANRFDVTCLLLLNATATLPPVHGSVLRDAGVVGRRVVLHDDAAVQLAGRRLHDGAMPVERCRGRPVHGAQPLQVVVLDRRVEPLHGDVEVAFERAGRRLVERQLDVAAPER